MRRSPFPAHRRTRSPSRSTPSTPPRHPLRERETVKHVPSLGQGTTNNSRSEQNGRGALAYPTRRAGGRRRRGGARRRRSRRHGPCRAPARPACCRLRQPRAPTSLSVSVSTRPDPRGNPWLGLGRWEAARAASLPILARDPTDGSGTRALSGLSPRRRTLLSFVRWVRTVGKLALAACPVPIAQMFS